MHIYFSGIGGAGIGPLAQIAHQAGYLVSGSDKQDSDYIHYLRNHGIKNIHIGQSRQAMAEIHDLQPIDWFVYTSALPLENPNAPELLYCSEQNIKTSKRDVLLNQIISDKKLKLIAVAGTHGKTTTTALVIWLFKQLKVPLSYVLPAKTNFAEMGAYDASSEYFIYEADEFDRNFLAFSPHFSIVTGVTWDHHEIFPTREDYKAAFVDFISQSQQTVMWQEDAMYLQLTETKGLKLEDSNNQTILEIKLKGFYNRLDAWLAIQAVSHVTGLSVKKLLPVASSFPGLQRRMEEIIPNLFSDYAHTPEKIRGVMSVAKETAAESSQSIIIVYEPLTNRRQHFMLSEYQDCFNGAEKIYWLPSYLAREDPLQRLISPTELISHLDNPLLGIAAERNSVLKKAIQKHLEQGDMVVVIAGGGGNSLDDWIRHEFQSK